MLCGARYSSNVGYGQQTRHKKCTHNVTLTGFRVTIVAVEKEQVLHILSVSVALFIRHAKRMRHTILSSVACLAVPYSPSLSIKGMIFKRKKKKRVFENKVCVLTFSTTFV